MASKGKGIAGKNSPGKRKRGDDDKTGGGKRKNRSVLQFFEEAVCEDSDSSFDIDDLFDDDDLLFDFDTEPTIKSEPGKSEQFRVFPKEEELSGDELEQMLEERYRSGSGYVRYAEDGFDNKRSVDRSFVVPSVMEPAIWKVKCKVGRERNTVFCLMQKYVDLKVLGTKLQIISAFAVEHIKGFVFIEAEKQSDVAEACNQLADVYFSLMTKVPPNEVSQLLVVRRRYNEVKEGTWARVKNGIYRGDIAQVVAVNNERKRATVKLIPRVDMQALAAKYGGATVLKKTKNAIPAARLISSSELDEFRPLMQCRRDRDTGKIFEFLDGLMLKDGFLYKKVSIDSLSFWDVNPTEEELQKFTLPSNDESDNLEWLSQLYGEQKKKNNVTVSKGGGKGEGSSGSNEQSSFEVHDLVLFGKREFGIVIGMEKDENYKILKCGTEGPVTLNLGQKDLKYVPLDKKFTALDLHMKTISVNDTVRILHGPSKDRQGTVKQIYRGIIFLYDENDFDNAYFCAKSQEAEKVRHIDSACRGKDEDGPSGFEDAPSSPKSPLATQKPWQMREDERRDKDGMFSVGQSLRIRIGPLKGYLCRVLAVRFSDVTVKLDSQQKVLTVKREHLSEVRGKSSATLMGDDTGLNSSFRPFDLLGSEGNTNDWLQGASGTTDGDGWNVGGPSGERSAWPAFSSGALVQGGTSAGTVPNSVDNDSGKDAEDAGWLGKVNNNPNSSWGAGNNEVAGSSGQAGGWGSSDGGWGKSGTGASSSWENAKAPGGDHGGSWKAGSSVDQGKDGISGEDDPWDKGKKIVNETSWAKQTTDKGLTDSWNKGQGAEEAGGWSGKSSHVSAGSSGWGKQASEKSEAWGKVPRSTEQNTSKPSGDAWGVGKGSNDLAEDSWGKTGGKWGNKSSTNESNEWKSSAVASVSQSGAWGQAQEMGKPSGGAWGEAKGTNDSAGDSWGKAAVKWGNKDAGNEWKSSAAASEPQAGGWGQTNAQNEQWSKSENATDWGKGQEGDHWNKSEGNRSWDESRRGDDQGYRGRGFGGRRGRGGNRGGRDQSGRGRGGSFDRSQSSSWNQENQTGSSWHSSIDGSKDQASSWGNNKGWSSNSEKEGWCQSGGPTESNKLNSVDHSSERTNDTGGWKQQTSWDKSNSGDDNNSTWGKSTWSQTKGSDESWATYKNSEDKVTEGTSNDPWGKVADKWGSQGNSSKGKEWKSSADTPEGDVKGWGKGFGDSTHSQVEKTGGGWKDGGGWKSGGDSWGKPKSFGADDSGGNDSWGQSKSFDNDRGFSGGRGSGGRRGRGRDNFGRGRGRSFDRGNSSSWNKDGQDAGPGASWSKDQGGSSLGNSSWSKDSQEAGAGSSWSKDQGGSSWGNASKDSQDVGAGASWSKDQGGSSWGNSGGNKDSQEVGAGASWGKNQGGSWGNAPAGSGGTGNTWGGGQSEEKNAMGGSWHKGGSSDSGGWNKGSDGGSWSKPGNDSWERPSNFENDQGFGRGGGLGGRRGRGGFRGGRDYGGRGGGRNYGGRVGGRDYGGRGQFSSWKSDNQGGSSSSWGNSSGGNNWGNSWSSSGGDDKGSNPSTNQSGGWGKAKSWNDSGAGNADKESGGNNKGWSQGWSSSGGDDKGILGSKPTEGTSWGADKSNDQGSSWGKAKSWNDNGADNAADKESGGSKGWGTGQGSSWGNSSGGNNDDKATESSSWGKAKGWNDNGANNEDKGSAGNKTWNADQGGSSSSAWENSSRNKEGSSWGGSSSGGASGAGGGGWA